MFMNNLEICKKVAENSLSGNEIAHATPTSLTPVPAERAVLERSYSESEKIARKSSRKKEDFARQGEQEPQKKERKQRRRRLFERELARAPRSTYSCTCASFTSDL